MIPPRRSAGQSWRSAITLAILIALAVGVVGTAVVLVTTDATLVDALFAVVPGMGIGAAASLLLVLLGSRPGRGGSGGRSLEQRFQEEWRRRDEAEREQAVRERAESQEHDLPR